MDEVEIDDVVELPLELKAITVDSLY